MLVFPYKPSFATSHWTEGAHCSVCPTSKEMPSAAVLQPLAVIHIHAGSLLCCQFQFLLSSQNHHSVFMEIIYYLCICVHDYMLC